MRKGGDKLEHFNEILKYTLEILAILGISIEIAPIKFSPFKWVGNKFNSDIKKDLDDLKKDLKVLKIQVDKNDIRTIRHRISSFENLVRLDKDKNQLKMHQYTTAFKDIDKWNRYHLQYPELNGELKIAIKNIEEGYKNAKFDD